MLEIGGGPDWECPGLSANLSEEGIPGSDYVVSRCI